MPDKDIKTIAKEVKQELSRQYPRCKWAVSIKRFSGGQELNVALLSAPFQAFARETGCNGNAITGYSQLNQYQFQQPNGDNLNNGAYLTQAAWDCMANAYRIASRDNWDRSDTQTDYFDVNYWLHMAIGRWDRPFTCA